MLGIKQGDKVAFSIREGNNGEAVPQPVRSVVEATYGIAGSGGPPVDLAALRERFEEGLVEDALEGLSRPDQDP